MEEVSGRGTVEERNGRRMTQEGIDFVITWVDGGDKAWRKEKAKYDPAAGNDDGEERYRDWELLKYWFRGVEKFAPWVRKIHFITWGHLPEWLDTSHPKLHIVRHEDYIPKEYLPVFNSNVLEIYMHKIKGLSEKFVYFNDDFFFVKETSQDYFFRNGRPCDMLALQPVVANAENPVMSHLYLNNSLVLCKYFDKRENIMQHPGNYFKLGYPPLYFCYNMLELAFPRYTCFYTVHGPSPYQKETFEELWEKEEKLLTEMSYHRFRDKGDVTPYLFREWQKLSNQFVPKNIEKEFRYFNVGVENSKLLQTIKKQKKKIICINDQKIGAEFERVKQEVQEAFQTILPEVSSFERRTGNTTE